LAEVVRASEQKVICDFLKSQVSKKGQSCGPLVFHFEKYGIKPGSSKAKNTNWSQDAFQWIMIGFLTFESETNIS
jgi:hypothetical protein